MWVFNGTLPEIALRATIIYAVVLLGIRLAGKREVGQMTSLALPGGPQERDALSRDPPTLLIHNGKPITEHLKREHISVQELQQSLREHGISDLAEVFQATLEVDGAISVPRNDERPTTARPHHRFRFIRSKYS